MAIGRIALLVVVVAGAWLAPRAQAETESASLTLPQALARSLGQNPALMAFGFELEAQAGRIQQAGARPPPEVQMLAENVLGSGARSSFDAAEITLSIALSLEHGARDRRLAAAFAGNELLTIEQRMHRLDVAAETARRFIDLLECQQLIENARAASALGGEMLVSVQKRLRAAQVPRAEEARAQARLARLQLDEEHAEHQLAVARQRLAAQWGNTEPDFGTAQGEVLELPPLEEFAVLRARLAESGDFERMLSEKRLREAEVRLAEMRRRPPWQVTAGVRRFEDESDHAVIVGVSVPIGTRGAAQGAIAEAQAKSAQADALAEALRVQLATKLFGIYQELRHSHAEVTTLRDTVLPRMTDAAEQSRHAYERGRYAYGEWVAAQAELLGLRRDLLRASADLHRRRIEIERLTGTAVAANPTP